MFTNNLLYQAIQGTPQFCRKYLPLHSCILLFAAASASGQSLSEPTPTIKETVAQTNGQNSKSDARTNNSVKDSEIEEMVVVGSRIRHANLKTISPVTVITREAATAAGFNSTADMLQGTAVTAGASQINNAYGGYATDGGPGTNTISLRGLGAGRTLVLINGRRVAPAGTRGAVGSADLNVLPTAMIERVEVLRDGASSIYGSDAIGGVVNVITLEEVEGLFFEAEYNHPTEGEGEQSRFSITGGLAEDRWSFSGSLDYYERADLTLADRDWTRCNTHGFRDPQTGESRDFIDPKTGKPKCYPTSGTGANGTTINTIGTQNVTAANYQSLGLNGPPVGAPGSAGSTFNRFRPNAGIATGIIGFEGVGGGDNNINVRDTFDPDMLNENLIAPVKIYTTFMQGKYDLQALGDAELYVELLGHRRDSSQTGYRQLTMDYRRGSPLIPDELAFSNYGADQGTSGGNRVGVRAFIGFGNDEKEQKVNFYKPTLGIRGDLDFMTDWRYDFYASHSTSDADYRAQAFLIDKLTYASDVLVAPDGTDASLVRDGITCQINLTNPDERCIPYPALTAATIGGDLPQDFVDYIFRDVNGETRYDESVISAIVDGPLFTMPAGKAQGVFGLEHRRAEIDDQPDPQSIVGNIHNASIAAPTKGKDNVTELYTELELPLLAELRFAEELTANGSFRYTDYDSYGSDNTYKLGLIYSPASWISLRGTQGTSFRAPALFEQYQGATVGFRAAAGDPCNNYGEAVDPVRATNCATELPGQPEFQATNGIQVINAGGATTGLFAETSKNLTYGIIVQPALGDQGEFSFGVDYFDIEIENGVDQAGVTNILQRCYDDPQFRAGGGLCRLVTRDPVTNQLTVSDAFTNIATQTSRGLDFTTRYERDLGPGNLLVNLSVTRYLSQANKLFEDDEVEELNGTMRYPELSGSGDISYALGAWRFTYGVEWIASMDSYKFAEEDPLTSELDLAVPSYLEHRFSTRYQADKWKATLGVRNLTNETPPTISALEYNRVGNAPLYSGYDYVGREIFINVQLEY